MPMSSYQTDSARREFESNQFHTIMIASVKIWQTYRYKNKNLRLLDSCVLVEDESQASYTFGICTNAKQNPQPKPFMMFNLQTLKINDHKTKTTTFQLEQIGPNKKNIWITFDTLAEKTKWEQKIKQLKSEKPKEINSLAS